MAMHARTRILIRSVVLMAIVSLGAATAAIDNVGGVELAGNGPNVADPTAVGEGRVPGNYPQVLGALQLGDEILEVAERGLGELAEAPCASSHFSGDLVELEAVFF